MASFIEQATLKVNDQSSAQIAKINAALKTLFTTAKSLKSITVNIKINDSGIQKAITNMRSLKREMDRMGGHGGATKLKVTVDQSGIAAAKAQIQALRAAAAKPIKVAMATGGGAGGRPPGAVPLVGGRGGGRGTGGTGAAGVGGGGGGRSLLGAGGFSGPTTAFFALESAAYAAAAALKKMATAGAAADRASLKAGVVASQKQLDVIEKMGGFAAPPGQGPIRMTNAERKSFVTSLLGDVSGDTEEERAKNAVTVARMAESKLLPRIYAADPSKSREESLEGLRKLVQATNLATTNITDKTGKVSEDAERVISGIMKAQVADPDLTPNTIRTALANLKTGGYGMDSDSIARVLMNVGDRGVRAANEAFRAQKGLSGTADIKVLNNKLAAMGLLEDVKRNAKGNVVAGSGRAADEDLLQKDPSAWLHKKGGVVDQMNAQLKSEGKDVQDSAARIAWINRTFAGMSSAGLQGITDLILTADQANQKLKQANVGLGQDVTAAAEKSWTAQLDSAGVELQNAAAQLMTAATALGAPGLLGAFAEFARNNPTTAAVLAGGASVAGGALQVLGPYAALLGAAKLFPSWFGLGAGAAAGGAAGAAGGAAAGGIGPAVAQFLKTVAGTAAGGTAGGATAAVAENIIKFAFKRLGGALGMLLFDSTEANAEGANQALNKTNQALKEQEKAQGQLNEAQQQQIVLENALKSGRLDPAQTALATAALDQLKSAMPGLQTAATAAAEAVKVAAEALAKDVTTAAEKALTANKRVADAFDALGIKKAEEPVPRAWPQPKAPPLAKPTPAEQERLDAMKETNREAARQRKAAERERQEQQQRDRERGDPADIIRESERRRKGAPPPVWPDGKPPELPVKITDSVPLPIPKPPDVPPVADAIRQAIDTKLLPYPKPEEVAKPGAEPQLIRADQPIPVVYPPGESKAAGKNLGAPPTAVPVVPQPTTSAASELQTAAPGIGSMIAEPLKTAASSITSAFGNLGSTLSSAGEALKSAGSAAAEAIKGGASSAGTAYGNAAAAIIKSAVANVTISVQHSGSAGGHADPGTSKAAP